MPQIKVFAGFLLKLFRFNCQQISVQKDQSPYIVFPQTFYEKDSLPFIIKDEFKQLKYVNPLELHIPYFDIVTLDTNFFAEHSETSDSQPYATIPTLQTLLQHLMTLISKNPEKNP